jgi:hypothetical protein
LEYNQAHESIKVLEDSKQLAKNNILALMKDAEVLEFNDGKVTWRYAFNATAPVAPGFEAVRAFVL